MSFGKKFKCEFTFWPRHACNALARPVGPVENHCLTGSPGAGLQRRKCVHSLHSYSSIAILPSPEDPVEQISHSICDRLRKLHGVVVGVKTCGCVSNFKA